MRRRLPRPAWAMLILVGVIATGCQDPTTKVRLQRELDQTRRTHQELERAIASQEARARSLEDQIRNLSSFDDPAGRDLFDPVRLDILAISGGSDFDGQPGDDGVTVHVRPIDADGNVVTVGGRITVQVVDNTVMGKPRVVGLCRLDDPEAVRAAWHGRFLTSQYVIKCPFKPDADPTSGTEVEIRVEFIDFRTGKRLHAERTVPIHLE